jgi:hypothetical protein
MMVLACQLHEWVSSPVTLRNLQQKPLDADISIMLFVQNFGWSSFCTYHLHPRSGADEVSGRKGHVPPMDLLCMYESRQRLLNK